MMNRRELLKVAGMALLAGPLGGCMERSETFRYRMTVEVETPEGLRSGSSVIEVRVSDPGRGPYVLPQQGTGARVRGEAVAVDLPGGKVLFALLSKPRTSTGAEEFAYEALRPSRYTGEYGLIDRTEEMMAMDGVGVLPKEAYPQLVTFNDLGDPTSAREVDPNDLSGTFSDGATLRRITVEMTRDPVTNGIQDRLVWWASTQGALEKMPFDERARIVGEGGSLPISTKITAQNFSRGL